MHGGGAQCGSWDSGGLVYLVSTEQASNANRRPLFLILALVLCSSLVGHARWALAW